MTKRTGAPMWRGVVEVDVEVDLDKKTGQGFYGKVRTMVTLDHSGDRITPDGPAEVDPVEAIGSFSPHPDADFEDDVRFEAAGIPQWIVDVAEESAIDKAEEDERDAGDDPFLLLAKGISRAVA